MFLCRYDEPWQRRQNSKIYYPSHRKDVQHVGADHVRDRLRLEGGGLGVWGAALVHPVRPLGTAKMVHIK